MLVVVVVVVLVVVVVVVVEVVVVVVPVVVRINIYYDQIKCSQAAHVFPAKPIEHKHVPLSAHVPSFRQDHIPSFLQPLS